MDAVEYIKSNLTENMIITILEYYGVKDYSLSSKHIHCCCPIHGGDNSSAFVWTVSGGIWYCNTGCQRGGDVFTFVASMEHLSEATEFNRIVELTAEIMSLNIDSLERHNKRNEIQKDIQRYIQLQKKKKNIELSFPFNINRIGAMEPAISYRNFTKETLSYFGIKISSIYNRLFAPIKNLQGEVIGVTGRALDGDRVKWLHKPDSVRTGNTFFNIENIAGTSITIVEGVFDVMNLYQECGLLNACGSFGAHLTEEQYTIIMKRFTSVCLMYDGDIAGIKATLKATMKLKNTVDLRIYELPLGKDPGDLTKEEFDNMKVLKPHEFINKHRGLFHAI